MSAFSICFLKFEQTSLLKPIVYLPSTLFIVNVGDELSFFEPSLFASSSSKRFLPSMFICTFWTNETSFSSTVVLILFDTVTGY